MTPVEDILDEATAQDGDEYVFGAETSPHDPDPDFFDCSELVQWSCGRTALDPVMPDGSWIQARHCNNYGLLITVEEGIDTRGALLFKFSADPLTGARPSSSHVAFSMGNGQTFEARSSYYDIGYFTAEDRGWTHAALIPGADYEEEDMDYRGVINVPDQVYARGVVDWGIQSGIIVTGDDYQDDWDRDSMTDGRLWTFLYRFDQYLHGGER